MRKKAALAVFSQAVPNAEETPRVEGLSEAEGNFQAALARAPALGSNPQTHLHLLRHAPRPRRRRAGVQATWTWLLSKQLTPCVCKPIGNAVMTEGETEVCRGWARPSQMQKSRLSGPRHSLH